jgi:hypothetical protein
VIAAMLVARADGLLESARAVRLPFMAPRLQGELRPDGSLDLALWGAGALGRVRCTPLAGPLVYGPNRAATPAGGLFVAQSRPVALRQRARLLGLAPASRAAIWAEPVEAAVAGGSLDLPWGRLIAEQRGDCVVIAAGADAAEAQAALALPSAEIVAEAKAYVAACDRLPEADPVLRSMVMQGAHAALSSARRDAHGRFAGLAAGLAYGAPARTYFRDSYWTTPFLLQTAPAIVAAQIEILAEGVRPDGEAPSGVILGGDAQAQAWGRALATTPAQAQAHGLPHDWWSDHFDSPLYFVLMVADYVRATGDDGPARRYWDRLTAVLQRYRRLADDSGLPSKPRNDRDWADNVYRAGLVAYDLGLWIGAAEALAELALCRDETVRREARAAAAQARAGVEARLWRPAGWYADYAAPDGFVEDHLALDSLMLAAFDATRPGRALAVLDAIRGRLETRSNDRQPYGDWGMLCAFPPYRRRADLRSKSAFPFRYHNGGAWPWLDGLYAGQRLRRGLGGWRYPLTRWWEICLANGWPAAVEHYSPPYGRGSLLQAWSSLPAAVAVSWRQAVLAGDREA